MPDTDHAQTISAATSVSSYPPKPAIGRGTVKTVSTALSRPVAAALLTGVLCAIGHAATATENPAAVHESVPTRKTDSAAADVAQGRVSGQVMQPTVGALGLSHEPVEGVRLNAYWQPAGFATPSRTVSVVTNSNGQYELTLPAVGADGQELHFDGSSGQQVRVWPDLRTLPEGMRLVSAVGAGRLHGPAQATGALWRDGEIAGLNFEVGQNQPSLMVPPTVAPVVPQVPNPASGSAPPAEPGEPTGVAPTQLSAVEEVTKIRGQVNWAANSTGVQPARNVQVALDVTFVEAGSDQAPLGVPQDGVSRSGDPAVVIPPATKTITVEGKTDDEGRYQFDLPVGVTLGTPGTALDLRVIVDGRTPLESREVSRAGSVVTANVLLDSTVEVQLDAQVEPGVLDGKDTANVTVTTSGLPPHAGPYTLELLDSSGSVIHRCKPAEANHSGQLPVCQSTLAVESAGVVAVLRDDRGQVVTQSGLRDGQLRAAFDSRLPIGVVGTSLTNSHAESIQLAAIGGQPPYVYALESEIPGLVLDPSTGALTGNPAESGTFEVAWSVTDAEGQRAQYETSLRVIDTSELTVASEAKLVKGRVGQPLDAAGPVVVGGQGPTVVQAVGLPSGVSVSRDTGVIRGVPNESGTFTLTWTISDKTGATVTTKQTLEIDQAFEPLTWTGLSAPTLTAGKAIAGVAFTASGGSAPYTYSADGLPPGVSMDANSGALSGVVHQPSDAKVRLKVVDSVGQSADREVTLSVVSAETGLRLQLDKPPPATVGVRYAHTEAKLVGVSEVALFSGEGLPQGLAIDPLTGQIQGVPAEAGLFTVTVTATTSRGQAARSVVKLAVRPAADTISLSYPEQTSVSVGTKVTLKPTTQGGSQTYRYRADSLPDGLVIDTDSGEITGTVDSVGDAAITISVIDSEGNRGTTSFTLSVEGKAAELTAQVEENLQLATIQGRETDVQLVTVRGGQAPYRVTATGLPDGMAVDGSGRLTGVSSSSGSYPITLRVTDARGATVDATAVLRVGEGAKQLVVGLAGPTTRGQVSGEYSLSAPQVTGGSSPFTFEASGLPNGLRVDKATGEITGIPTKSGVYSVSVKVTDSVGSQASLEHRIIVLPENELALGISGVPTELPLSTGEEVSAKVFEKTKFTNSVGKIECSAEGLPVGINIVPTQGTLQGSSLKPGSYNAQVTCLDEAEQEASYTLPILVAAPTLTIPTEWVDLTLGDAVGKSTPSVGHSPAHLGWKYSAQGLPEGVQIESATGELTGSPSATGTYRVVVTASPHPVMAIATPVARQARTVFQPPAKTSWPALTSTVTVNVTSTANKRTSVSMPYSQHPPSPFNFVPPQGNWPVQQSSNAGSRVSTSVANTNVGTTPKLANLGYLATSALANSPAPGTAGSPPGTTTLQHLATPATAVVPAVAVLSSNGRSGGFLSQKSATRDISSFVASATNRIPPSGRAALAQPSLLVIYMWMTAAMVGALTWQRRRRRSRVSRVTKNPAKRRTTN